MSSKGSIHVTTPTTPADLRNVVLVGSSGSGKTTLFENLLKTAIPGYRGERDDPERAAALTLAAIPAGAVRLNLLDAPGHPDYVGELRAGLRAADAAVFVVSATDGIDNTTANLWHECQSVGMPRAIVVTKLDTNTSDYQATLATCQEHFGEGVLPAYLPLRNDSGEVTGNMSLVSRRVHDYSSGSRVARLANDDENADIDDFRAPYVEGIITESDDEDLMERYLEGDELASEEVVADFLTAVSQGNFFPVIPVLTTNGAGTQELLGIIERGFPTPDVRSMPLVSTPEGDPVDDLIGDQSGALLAEVVRTTSDQYAGRLSMVRVFSGTLRQDDTVHVSGHRELFTGHEDSHHPDHDVDEKVGPMSAMQGLDLAPRDKAIAGDIVFVAKLAHAETSDTLSSKDAPLLIEPWTLPEPLLPMAVKAATRDDEDKLASTLNRLVVEDTTVRLDRPKDTDQLILWTMGQAHTDLLLNRLNERYGVRVTSEPVKVALRETFIAPVTAHGRHVKQSGGHGQYAVCDLKIEPGERGSGFEFFDKVVGGAVPRQFIPSVEKGIRNQLEKGTITGYPMIDIKVTLYDGKAHSVDSSDMAFQMAGAHAVKDAADEKTVALLEPLDRVVVTVGEEYLGQVMTDLSNRRGQVTGTDADTEHHVIVSALVPQSELSRYAIDLRGIAHGSGEFTREFHGYDLLPPNQAGEYLS